MSESLESVGSCTGGWNFHLQFTPYYRKQVFYDVVVKEACEREAFAVAERLGVTLAASEFGPDHWHVFITGAKNYSAPQLAHQFKGATSRVIRRDHWHRIKEVLWGECFWSHGYFAETIGRVTSDTVKYYIERMQSKHWL